MYLRGPVHLSSPFIPFFFFFFCLFIFSGSSAGIPWSFRSWNSIRRAFESASIFFFSVSFSQVWIVLREADFFLFVLFCFLSVVYTFCAIWMRCDDGFACTCLRGEGKGGGRWKWEWSNWHVLIMTFMTPPSAPFTSRSLTKRLRRLPLARLSPGFRNAEQYRGKH